LLVDTRDELVLDNGTITFPVFSVLDGAAVPRNFSLGVECPRREHDVPFEVTATTVDKHCDEEHGIKVRDGGSQTDDRSPGEAHSPVGNIVLPIDVLASTKAARKMGLTGLREYAHQPLVRRRLLRREGCEINMESAPAAIVTYP
jgi:hypothetical protein